jgi:hypothetical protein
VHLTPKDWIASAFAPRASADAVGARAPRNDEGRFPRSSPPHCERSEAIQEPRVVVPGHPHHVTQRGIGIFNSSLRKRVRDLKQDGSAAGSITRLRRQRDGGGDVAGLRRGNGETAKDGAADSRVHLIPQR